MPCTALNHHTLSLIIDSRLEDVFLVGLAVRGICRQVIEEKEVPGHLELCVVEAVNNAIKHAYGGLPGNEVRISVTLFPDRVVLTVSDQGKKMAATNHFSDREPQQSDAMPESGMGLFIIHRAADQVEYSSKDGWNTMTMTKWVRVTT